MADHLIVAEDLLSTVGEAVGLIVMVWELDQHKIFASEQWAALVGGPAGATCIEQASMLTYLHPDDIAAFDRAIVGCLKGDDSFYDAEIRVRAHSGEWHWLSVRGRVTVRNAARRATRMLATFIDAGGRKIAEQALADSEARYRATFEVSMQSILLATPDGQILSANPAACRLLGYSEDELVSVTEAGLGNIDEGRLTRQLRSCVSNSGCEGDAVLVRKDGVKIEVESSLVPFSERSGALRISIELHDVSHARQIERRLQRITKLYDARSRCNRAVIDSRTREELFQRVCQIVVDCGDFGLVWIALASKDSINVGAAFASGPQRQYLRDAQISVDPNDALGRGPLGRSIREGKAIITNDFLNEPTAAPWHALSLRYNFQSSAAFPLEQLDETIGALMLYAPEKDYFDAPLISLLAEIASDVSFGLDNLQRKSALESSEKRFRTLWEASTDAIVILTEESIIRFANPAVQALLGHAPDSLIGQHLSMLQPERFRHAHNAAMRHYLVTGERTIDWTSAQVRGLHLDGREIPIEIAFSQADIGGEALFIGFMRDVTERKRSLDLMSNQNHILKMISSGSDLPPTLAEIARLVESHARDLSCAIQILPDQTTAGAFATIDDTGFHAQDTVEGSDTLRISSGVDSCITRTRAELEADPALADLHAIAQNHPTETCRLWPIVGRQRQLIAYLAVFYSQVEALADAERSVLPSACELAGLAIENKKSDARIRYLAHFDELTGLPNRACFMQRLSQAIARAARYQTQAGMLFVDLDRFKNINDSHGHEVGDKVLREVAARLTASVREVDMVARLGGDEFVILAEDVADNPVLANLAQKLIDKIAQPFHIDGDLFHLTASVGISTYPGDGDDLYALIKSADIAMYRVKELGRNGHQFYAEQMSADTRERIILEEGLRHVVERNELLLHYQPKLDLATGGITGVEALVRWQHPVLGLLGPARFIPLAEDTGMIVAIGKWVLQTACRQLGEWIGRDLAPMRIAVNLSARQFRYGMLFQDVQEALQQAGLSPQLLELEVTESLVMENPERAVQLLGRFKALGVSLSMDDFGTGYSSLANLKSFPFDSVKVDRSFVRDIVIDQHDAAIARAIIAMAHVLHLRVIAEGVETSDQLAFLREHDCDEIQGYHFSRPMPAAAIEEFLIAHQNTMMKAMIS